MATAENLTDKNKSRRDTTARSTAVTRIVGRGQGLAFEIPSPTGPKPVELLNGGEETYCVIRGTIPAAGIIPLHRHDDSESFFVLSGEGEVLAQTESGPEWRTTRTGDFIDTCGAKHAWRNHSKNPIELIIVTTPKLGKFLRELNDVTKGGNYSVEELRRLSESYGYWVASPQENAQVGIPLP